ncbi:hypothetical protein [Spirosoma profusum]|nr:hypothetical protein [Spirosoma profusum]
MKKVNKPRSATLADTIHLTYANCQALQAVRKSQADALAGT